MSVSMKTIVFGALSALTILGAAGCNSTIHKQSYVGGVDTLSLDAKQRLVLFGTDSKGAPIVCAEPSPDALVAQAAVLAAQGAVPTQGGQGQAGFTAGTSESAASIGLRTATIQTLRDGYYRLCEGYLNGSISKEHYHLVVNGIDEQMTMMMALDALGGMRAAPAVAISGGSFTGNAGGSGDPSVTGGGGGASGKDGAIANLVVQEGLGTAAVQKEQAEAIQGVVREYFAFKQWMVPRILNNPQSARTLTYR